MCNYKQLKNSLISQTKCFIRPIFPKSNVKLEGRYEPHMIFPDIYYMHVYGIYIYCYTYHGLPRSLATVPSQLQDPLHGTASPTTSKTRHRWRPSNRN